MDAEFLLREIRELTVYLPSKSYIKTLWEVLGYIKAASSKNGFSFPVDNYDELEGFAAYFRATETPSIYELPEAMVDEVAGKDMFKRTLHKLASRSRRRKSQRFIGGEGI